jgi:hypothetical protein
MAFRWQKYANSKSATERLAQLISELMRHLVEPARERNIVSTHSSGSLAERA